MRSQSLELAFHYKCLMCGLFERHLQDLDALRLLLKHSEDVSYVLIRHDLLVGRRLTLSAVCHANLSSTHCVIKSLEHAVICVVNRLDKCLLHLNHLVLLLSVHVCDTLEAHHGVELPENDS